MSGLLLTGCGVGPATTVSAPPIATFLEADPFQADPGTNSAINSTCVFVAPQAGDLIVVVALTKNVGVLAATISNAFGLTYTTHGSQYDGTGNTVTVFSAIHDGAATQVAVGHGATNCNSSVALIFRAAGQTFTLNQALATAAYAATLSPAVTGQTPSGVKNTVSVAIWTADDDNTWGTLTGAGWVVAGTAQYRNNSSTDHSIVLAYKIQAGPPAATGSPTMTQLTLGPDLGNTGMITFDNA